MATKLENMAEELLESQLENIQEAIDELNKKLAVYDRVKEKRDQLMAARRALLGTVKLTGGGGGNRITQGEVIEVVREHPGLTPQELAEASGIASATLRGHLSRGKDERFLNHYGRWYLRDPKEGINTVEDLDLDNEDNEYNTNTEDED